MGKFRSGASPMICATRREPASALLVGSTLDCLREGLHGPCGDGFAAYDVSSSFAMETITFTTVLSTEYAR
jgi:hypothetical protein